MGALDRLREGLREPALRGIDVDSAALLERHVTILRSKRLLRSAFETFYREMLTAGDRLLPASGIELELGSGAGFLKTMRQSVITTDIRRGPHIDRVIDAHGMDLCSGSVRCIYAINVFHHLRDPDLFFGELKRVLKPGGGCVLVEPHCGAASAFVHRHLHSDEIFDPLMQGWTNDRIAGPLSGANQALAHIVFERDLAEFRERHGMALEIVHESYILNAMRYLLSGGLNFRQLVPSVLEPLLRGLEQAGGVLAKHWSLHRMTVLRRAGQ